VAVKTPIWPMSDGIQVTIESEVIFIDDKSDDCGYTGGVNYTSDEENNVENNAWFDNSDTKSEKIDGRGGIG
jgi:beta-mannanase